MTGFLQLYANSIAGTLPTVPSRLDMRMGISCCFRIIYMDGGFIYLLTVKKLTSVV